jgi:hypothetical protein
MNGTTKIAPKTMHVNFVLILMSKKRVKNSIDA